jgi:hypothetical protein
MKGLLDVSGQGKLSVPLAMPANASEVTVRRFGIDAPGEIFRTGWQFTIQNQSSAKILKTFVAGSIRYEPSTNRMVLTNLDVFGELVRQAHLPEWFPLPNYVLYTGIDEQQTRTVLLDYLNNRDTVRRALERTWGPSVLPADLVERFMNTELELPVPTNQPFAVAKQLDSTSRQVTVSIQVELGNADSLFVDPAAYPVTCHKHFVDLDGHPLETRLKRLWGGLLCNQTIRYVSKMGTASGPFTDPASPANTITLAVEAAAPHESVVILDNGIYQEDAQIEIEKELTITSLADVTVLSDSDLSSLPSIDANHNHRCVWIKDNAGMASVCNLAIINGRINTDISALNLSVYHGTSPAGGGGLVIDEIDRVFIGNCHIHNNLVEGYRAHRLGGSSALEGTDEDNFGGGIFVYFCSPVIANNRITNNSTKRRGGGVGIWGYGWPVLSGNIIANNIAERDEGGDGGAVAIEIAIPDHEWTAPVSTEFTNDMAWDDDHIEQARQNHVKFIGNQIIENRARDDGGGIYLSVMTAAYFETNLIQSNQSGGNGGGIRASFGSAIIMDGDSVLNNESNYLRNAANDDGGAGIACRDCQLFLSNVRIEDNTAYGWAGGGILFFSSKEGGRTLGDEDSYDEILAEVFNPERFTLAIDGNSSIANNRSVRLPGQSPDRRKGGGVYVLRFLNEVTGFLAFPIKVIIEDITRIQNNTLEALPDVIPAPDPDFPHSAQIHIEDVVHRPNNPIDDETITELLSNNSLTYESL